MRDFCYVVWYCYILTTETREDRQVPGSGKIGTEKPSATNLQLDSEQRVLYFNTRQRLGALEVIRACAQLEYALAIDPRQPCFTKLFFDL